MRISLWNSSLVKTQPIHFVLVPKSSRNFDLDFFKGFLKITPNTQRVIRS